ASEGPAEDVAAMIMRVIEGGAGYRAAAVEASGHLNWQTEVVSLIGVHNAALASQGGGRR
ncbi:MAG: hypothetical protein ACTHOG_07225, partial [Marmoricola sp.]